MTATAETADTGPARHVLFDLGWEVRRTADELRGSAPIVPEMHVPGTAHLRTSILAAWADTLAGLLAVDVIGPRVPVTLELDVHLYRPAPAAGLVFGVGGVVKSGRTVLVASVDFRDDTGEPFAFAAATFMPAPDVNKLMPPRTPGEEILPSGGRLEVPFAERAGCERVAPGVAVLHPSGDTLNAASTLNGGLIALAVEEAALSLSTGETLSTLDLRYLQPVRSGPAVAEAYVQGGLGRVHVRDGTDDHRLCVLCTTRTFG